MCIHEGRKGFEIVRQDLLLVNMLFGADIDKEVQVEAIVSGHEAGAALNMFDDEPLFNAEPG
jgi:phosphoglycerate dehydrogenase-like enzyme